MKKAVFLTLLVLSFGVSSVEAGVRRGPAAPNIFAPSENAQLAGKDQLEFRWGVTGEQSSVQYFDLRVYKGTETIEKNLIHTEKVPSRMSTFSMNADLFEDGQTYAWSIRTMGAQQKSRTNYTLFTVHKNAA